MRVSIIVSCAVLGLAIAVPVGAKALADDLSPNAILGMSLQDLANQEITSVSKKAEKATEAAAAIFVITQEDLRRSGATNIPEALRMVPGLNVAQSGAHDWAVTSRGFNDQFANKLLVLIDGRTVYSPLFSGVFWSVQDTLLEDIARIEVIRGPGATQWGANAVNGVINIITKNAKDTQGGLLTQTNGNVYQDITGGRYGTKIGDDSYVRAYAKYNDTDEQSNVGVGGSGDGWQKRQAGFRSDSKLTEKDSLTVQGDVYDMNERARYLVPNISSFSIYDSRSEDVISSGGNVLARWTRNIAPESSTSAQLYVDNNQFKTTWISYNVTTADFDFQHTWTGWKGHEVIWGVGYRRISDHTSPTPQFSLAPTERSDNLYSAFLQDKITLHPDDVFLTLGSKFEHNAYSGFEIQPSARLSWLISDTQTAWGSVSRAVHTPSRFTSDAQLVSLIVPGAPSALFAVAGNRGLDSEEMVAYELGYRIQPVSTVSLDMAAFYNDYSRLFAGALGTPSVLVDPITGAYGFQPINPVNTNSGRSYGFELAAKWDATQNWQLSGSYSYLNLRFEDLASTGFSVVGKQPKNQFNARSTYLFPHSIEMTNSLYYVDDLSSIGISSYYRFDTKLSYEVVKGTEFSIVGQNLFREGHREFSAFLYRRPAEIGRSVYANLTVRF